MPTRDDVYRKFGKVSEAAQLIEAELGTMLLFFGAVDEELITPLLEIDGKRAAELLARINRQTLGQLIKNTKHYTDMLDQLEPILSKALAERNRLTHHFYRQHNLRISTDAGRAFMLNDLETIHNTLIDVYKLLNLLSGTDLDALLERAKANDSGDAVARDETQIFHLPI